MIKKKVIPRVLPNPRDFQDHNIVDTVKPFNSPITKQPLGKLEEPPKRKPILNSHQIKKVNLILKNQRKQSLPDSENKDLSNTSSNFFRPGKQLHKFVFLGNTLKNKPKLLKQKNQSTNDILTQNKFEAENND